MAFFFSWFDYVTNEWKELFMRKAIFFVFFSKDSLQGSFLLSSFASSTN